MSQDERRNYPLRKFHRNPSTTSRVRLCQTPRERRNKATLSTFCVCIGPLFRFRFGRSPIGLPRRICGGLLLRDFYSPDALTHPTIFKHWRRRNKAVLGGITSSDSERRYITISAGRTVYPVAGVTNVWLNIVHWMGCVHCLGWLNLYIIIFVHGARVWVLTWQLSEWVGFENWDLGAVQDGQSEMRNWTHMAVRPEA